MVKNDVEEGKGCAILSYILIGIIWYFADEKMRKNAYAQFHAKQGVVLLITSILVSIIGSVLWWLPVLGPVIIWVLHIAIFLLLVLGIINAANGETKELPLIGEFAKHFNF